MGADLTNANVFPARDRLNDRMVREVRYTGPASYAAGGDTALAADVGLSQIYGVYGVITNGSAVRVAIWNFTTQALQFFVPNTGAEASGDLSGYTGTLLVTGRD